MGLHGREKRSAATGDRRVPPGRFHVADQADATVPQTPQMFDGHPDVP